MNNDLIIATKLHKSYQSSAGEVTVLKDMNLTIEKGEMLAIIGASGVGKSTLLHILGSLDHPSSGTVSYFGKNLFNQTEAALADFRNKNIGFVFQFHHLLPEFTALENVMMPQLIAGKSKKIATQAAQEILVQVGLEHRTTHKPGELSGGEQQRVALARALVNRPQAVLADEPTGNLDHTTSQVIFDLISELNQKLDTTFIMVTHDDELPLRCDRVLLMEQGQLVPSPTKKGGKEHEPV